MNYRPIKPATIESEADLHKLTFPLYAQIKYDGIRAGMFGGVAHSNTLKPLPNRYLQEVFAKKINAHRYYVDGEFILNNSRDFHEVQSAVMSRDGENRNLTYIVFDTAIDWNQLTQNDYGNRLGALDMLFRYVALPDNCRKVQSELVFDVPGILNFEKWATGLGFEGIILRNPRGLYKFGRCTWNDMNLFKFKRTADAEARIVGHKELLHNMNTLETDARGLAKRSSHDCNKVGSGMIGSFICVGINGKYKDKEFDVSCGSMTHSEKRIVWEAKTTGILTYTFAPTRGTPDAPAEPRFKCFRNKEDITP
jgi:DNA ligase-1